MTVPWWSGLPARHRWWGDEDGDPRHCRVCEVGWSGDTRSLCWVCGRPGVFGKALLMLPVVKDE